MLYLSDVEVKVIDFSEKSTSQASYAVTVCPATVLIQAGGNNVDCGM